MFLNIYRGENLEPIIYKINDNIQSLQDFQKHLENKHSERIILLDYPIVYIHNWKKGESYEVYVG